MVDPAEIQLGHLGAHVPRDGLGRYVKTVRFSLTKTFSTHEIHFQINTCILEISFIFMN